MNTQNYPMFNREETAELICFSSLVNAISQAAEEYIAGQIISPVRLVVPLNDHGAMISMPAVAPDIAIHKLVNIVPANCRAELPTIHGQVTVFNAETGIPLFVLDGPEVTGRRTAAVSILGVRTFSSRHPDEFLIIGTGTQSLYHLQAIAEFYPESIVWIRGSSVARTQAFCEKYASIYPNIKIGENVLIPPNVSVIIMLTTSREPLYNEQAKTGLLIIGVGAFKPDMAEIGGVTLFGSDIYIDDPAGAEHEAGDLIQAGIDWDKTYSLASALIEKPNFDRPIVFKTVGTGVWDLAAGRVAKAKLGL